MTDSEPDGASVPTRPDRLDPRAEVTAVLASLVGTTLAGVRYVGFPGEDAACRDDYTPDAAHFVEMDIELRCHDHPGVCFLWSNAMASRGEYELDAFAGPSILEIAGEDVWPVIQPTPDGNSYPWRAVVMDAHPTWLGRIGQRICEVRLRWYEGGVWDLMLSFEDAPLYLFCGEMDVVFVSPNPLSNDTGVELTEQVFVGTAPPT